MSPASRRWLQVAAQLWALALLFPVGFHTAATLGLLPCLHTLTGVRFGAWDLVAAVVLEVCWLGWHTLTPALLLASLPLVGAAWRQR